MLFFAEQMGVPIRKSVRVSVAALVIVIFLVGAVCFYYFHESWSVIDSIIFVLSTITTVGMMLSMWFLIISPLNIGSFIPIIYFIRVWLQYSIQQVVTVVHYFLHVLRNIGCVFVDY